MRLACVIFCFDRPQYLSQTLASIESQTIRGAFDWFFMVDGHIVGDDIVGDEKGRNEVLKTIVESELPKEEVFIAQHNKGMGKQKLFAHELFEYYDKVVFFEDDMILSRHYLEVLMHLYEKYGNHMITACDRNNDVDEEDFSVGRLDAVGNWNTHFWGYLLDKTGHEAVYEPLKDYCEIVGDNYRNRPANAIRNKFGVTCTSHDGILEKFLKIEGIDRLTTKIPRARYIGEWGMHCTPGVFKKHGFDKVKPFEFDEEPFRYDY